MKIPTWIVILAVSTTGCSQFLPSGIGCRVYGQTSLDCVLARVEEEEAKRTAKPLSTEEQVGILVITTGAGIAAQRYFHSRR